MHLSFAVQAHPARTELAEALAAEIHGTVVYDPAPDSKVRSPWRTFRHLLETTPEDATHRVTVQDDAILCPHFYEAVQLAVAHQPDRLIVFFVGLNSPHGRLMQLACEHDLTWFDLDTMHFTPTLATCWPVRLIPPLLEYVDAQRWPEKFVADDEIVSRFLRHTKERAVATVPSLAEHQGSHSLVRGGPRPDRQAALYIGDCDCSALELDWASEPGRVPSRRG